jgi:phosphoribosylanthranilate isomerase
MNRTRIKICGITSIEDALYVASMGCDAIGLNFYQKSPRALDIKQAQKICAALPALISKVALFVNPSEEYVYTVLNEVHVDTLQFHGSEHPDFCQLFNKPYIKALSVADNELASSFNEKLNLYSSASSILLDSFDPLNFGGSGKTFDWNLIPDNFRTRIILAGGLNPENVHDAIKTIRPYAVDVSSGVEQLSSEGELLKGKKDHKKIADFVKAVKQINQR